MNIQKEIATWKKEKLIPEKYLAVLEKRYENEKKGLRFATIIVCLGAALFGLGIITYMSANWEDFSKLAKTAFLFFVLIGSYATGMYFQKKEMSVTAIAFYLLGAILFGANIMLIAQTFNIQSHYPNGVLIWWLGIAPLTYLLRSKPLFILNAALFLLWVFLEFFMAFFEMQINEYLIIFSGILFFTNLLLLAFYFREKFQDFVPLIRKTALPTTFLLLFLLGINFDGGWTMERIWEGVQFLPIDGIVFIVLLALLFLIMFAALIVTKKEHSRLVLLLALITLFLGGLPLLISPSETLTTVFFSPLLLTENLYLLITKIAFLVITLLTVSLGVKLRKNKIINLGISFFGLEVLYIYFDLFGELMDTAFFFLSFGAFLLLFGYFLEKKRRSLLTS